MRGVLLAVLAAASLVACATQPEAASKSASEQAAAPTKQLHQVESAAYERGFLAGRRYQAKLDGSRPPLPCTAPPVSGTAAPAPAALTPAPAAPQPSPLPSSSYAPSGPAQPVTLP
ncbi:hypothetical protein [Acidocella aromatica]|uniref:Lipoprotein n=1 Tax=Acidocella aromatica TaxID=1303579 RepID=A0A840VFM1_9PROT|nr:hypothetical protein [Acidocella aromatica]MBB5372015.1 hypothetical protein [Acidocella aromatica]